MAKLVVLAPVVDQFDATGEDAVTGPVPEPDLSASFTEADKHWPAAVMERHFMGLVLGVIAAAVLLPIMR